MGCDHAWLPHADVMPVLRPSLSGVALLIARDLVETPPKLAAELVRLSVLAQQSRQWARLCWADSFQHQSSCGHRKLQYMQKAQGLRVGCAPTDQSSRACR